MYCGDGINDLAALAAADVGMAVGSSDASAAAAVVTKQNGIAGLPSLGPVLSLQQIVATWHSTSFIRDLKQDVRHRRRRPGDGAQQGAVLLLLH